MEELLSDNEKGFIILNRMKSVQSNKYAQEMLLIELNSAETLNTAMVNLANSEILEAERKLAALQAELDKLTITDDNIYSMITPSRPTNFALPTE